MAKKRSKKKVVPASSGIVITEVKGTSSCGDCVVASVITMIVLALVSWGIYEYATAPKYDKDVCLLSPSYDYFIIHKTSKSEYTLKSSHLYKGSTMQWVEENRDDSFRYYTKDYVDESFVKIPCNSFK